MTTHPILELCARIEGHDAQRAMLRNSCRNFSAWETLLNRAEQQGMTPLLKKHLDESGCDYPLTVRRSLSILARRHQFTARVRADTLQSILLLLQHHSLTPLVIKGAALCHYLYPDPALRPMRDIDVLMREEEAAVAYKLLQSEGFMRSSAPIPADHFHLPALEIEKEGMKVCIEIHRGLYPDCPPYYPKIEFEELLQESRVFTIGTTAARTFNDEETLHYLYQHGIRAPLTYETYKLINIADIISFTEKKFKTLDWERIRQRYPLLIKALPLMHHISPWDFSKIPGDFVSPCHKRRRLVVKSFSGWPKKRRREHKAEGRSWFRVLFDTFVPPVWWMGVYYGKPALSGRLWCLLYAHPRHVFWWVRLYSALQRASR